MYTITRAHAFIIVYTDDDRDSVDTAMCTLDELFNVRERTFDTPDTCMLVANKCDHRLW